MLRRVLPLAAIALAESVGANAASVDFDREIRPILSDRCFACHGPDEKQRMANLRLDKTESLFNDRGGYTLKARVNGKPRRGVVVAPSVWWKKYARDGGNANNVTSQRTTDLGGGATFYDCRVQVEPA